MQVKETRKNPRPGDGTPGPGRPKGVPNKATALLKDAILKAAETAGLASASDRTMIFAPSLSWSAPSITTRSPGCSPESTSTRSPSVTPT